MSATFSRFRLPLLALTALVGLGAALMLAAPGNAKKGDEECNGKPVDVFVEGTEPYRGDKSAEVIQGDSSDNEIHGHSGNDTICGGDGFDHLAGGEENDKIFGQGDNDRLYGRPGNDRLDGGPESDNDKAGKTPRRGVAKGKFFGDGCYGGVPNPDPAVDPDIPNDCEDERGVRQQEQETKG